jgi:hypothetical protein
MRDTARSIDGHAEDLAAKTPPWIYTPNTSQRYSNSPLMAQHNKAGSHEQRFGVLMGENFRLTGDFERQALQGRGC